MSESSPQVILDSDGPTAPPRANGELVFDSPWESRAFALAVALCQREGHDWNEFRTRLIEEISAWEAQSGEGQPPWSYYERWLAALERLILEPGLLDGGELDERTARVAHDAEREHDGHDHAHHQHH